MTERKQFNIHVQYISIQIFLREKNVAIYLIWNEGTGN